MTPEEIAAEILDVPLEAIQGGRRAHHIVRARYLAMAIYRYVHGWTFQQIGRHFGYHHSTVLYGLDRHFPVSEKSKVIDAATRARGGGR